MADKVLVGLTTVSDYFLAEMLAEELDCEVIPCEYDRDPAKVLDDFKNPTIDCLILIWEDPHIVEGGIEKVYEKWRAVLPEALFVIVSSQDQYGASKLLHELDHDQGANLTWYAFDESHGNFYRSLLEKILGNIDTVKMLPR